MGKIMHGDQVYSGWGGSVVEANPSDTASENLQKVKIDGSTYAIPQGGGGGAVDGVQVDDVSVVDQNGIAHIDTMTGAGSSSAGTKGLVPAPASGDNEKFLAGDGTWKPAPSGGASAVSDLTDVDLDNLSDGQILKWNATTEKWENANESGGVGNISALAYKQLTPTQYENLSQDEKKNGTIYFVSVNSVGASGLKVIIISQQDYDNLSPSEKNNGIPYFVN